jgi:hypothetical protein
VTAAAPAAAVLAADRLPHRSYDSLDNLRLMEGIVDVYLPDLKGWSRQAARRYLRRPESAAPLGDARHAGGGRDTTTGGAIGTWRLPPRRLHALEGGPHRRRGGCSHARADVV